MDSRSKPTKPRIIIHGGAGNITHANLPPRRQKEYKASLLAILTSSSALLEKGHTALDVATHAVTLFEDDPLFNCGRGAVFTRTGTIELEASIMISRGYRKRGVGCMLLTRVKHPIQLARQMLIKGEDEDGKGGGAYGHSQLSGAELEALATEWGLEIVDPSHFWTRRRWEEHKRGLEKERGVMSSVQDIGHQASHKLTTPLAVGKDTPQIIDEYLPQGTVGAVVLDSYGTLCVATSTGGLTNKLPGRIGDTPTLGAGFWAEEWEEHRQASQYSFSSQQSASNSLNLFGDLGSTFKDCLSALRSVQSIRLSDESHQGLYRSDDNEKQETEELRSVAMSGTGNGDSFLRTSAVRTAGAILRFSQPSVSLKTAIHRIAGPDGELQRSAEDRWGSGEGEGGIIGIELVNGRGKVAWDFNCGGLFRAWVDDAGHRRCMIFRDE